MKLIKIVLADICFYVGNNLVALSALLVGEKEKAKEIKVMVAKWIKNNKG